MPNSQDTQRRGPWQPAEDNKLLKLIEIHGPENWVKLSELVSTRTAKQCRERYHQKLKPDLNHTPITEAEGQQIAELFKRMGPRWAEISRMLGNRSDNAVKNYWNGSQNRQKRDEQRRHRHHYRSSHSHSEPSRSALHLQQPLPPHHYTQQYSHYHEQQQYEQEQQYRHRQHYQHHQYHRSQESHYSSPPASSPTRFDAVRMAAQPAGTTLPPLCPTARPYSQHEQHHHHARGPRSTLLPSINTTFQPPTAAPLPSPHWSTGHESPLSSPESATFDQSRLYYSHDADWRPATRDSSCTVGSVAAHPYSRHFHDQNQVPRRLPSPADEKEDKSAKDDRMTLKTILC
jgi:hypothetical protein